MAERSARPSGSGSSKEDYGPGAKGRLQNEILTFQMDMIFFFILPGLCV